MGSRRLLEEGRKDELWSKHCGYIGLGLEEYREIQERLLLEQIKLLGSAKIGKAMMGEEIPTSVDEFRQNVPMTTYEDYARFLLPKSESILPVKPYVWARTSGRTSSRGPKWIPYTKTMYDRLGDAVIGSMLMSACSFPGDVRLERNDRFLLTTAPPPYTSAFISHSTRDQLNVRFLPPLEEGEKMDYGSRVALGFRMAMEEGLDYFMGLASVLARMGEQFEKQTESTKVSKEMLSLPILWRLFKAVLSAKLHNRSILPRDIWKLKGIMSGGTDTEIYRDKIEYYWGRKPLEGFACTEGGNMAMQSWNYKGMIFLPDINFLEFIPLDEHHKNKANPDYIPKTVLYDELQTGVYELVFSNFHGGVFVRYRIGDFFEVISVGDEDLKSALPQLKFYSRAVDIIDLSSFVRITERDVWKAIENVGVPYQDWSIRKELDKDSPRLHLYIELKPGALIHSDEFKKKLDAKLSSLLPDFRDLKKILDMDPLQVTYLPEGSFGNYMKAKQEAGADLAHIKPPHMQASDEIIQQLLGN